MTLARYLTRLFGARALGALLGLAALLQLLDAEVADLRRLHY